MGAEDRRGPQVATLAEIPVTNIMPGSLIETHLERFIPGLERVNSGKVADRYRATGVDGQAVYITVRTDRKSAGDMRVAAIPLTGMVLTQMGAFWKRMMEQEGIKTDLIAVPHPNVQIAQEATDVQKVGHEIILRSHNVVSPTSTGMWDHFKRGIMDPYGIKFRPEDIPGPNRPFPEHMGRGGILFTPTTKEEPKHPGERAHDKPETEEQFRQDVDATFGKGATDAIIDASYQVFRRGKAYSEERGIILPDTKFEVAIIGGRVVFIDEMLTPDSSRFWDADSYEAQLAAGQNPKDRSKEGLRVGVANARKRQSLGSEDVPILTHSDLLPVQEGYLSVYRSLVGEELFVDSRRITDDEVIAASVGSFLQSHFNQRSS